MKYAVLGVMVVIWLSWLWLWVLGLIVGFRGKGLQNSKQTSDWYERPPKFWKDCHDLAMIIGDDRGARHYKTMYKTALSIESLRT